MADFVTLTCPTCGGKLHITPDLDRFACAHCGNEHLVKRSEGVIAIQPLAESLTGLRRATDRTASELAIRRLTDDLAQWKAALQHAEGMAAESRKVIQKHEERKGGCLVGLGGMVVTPLCYLVYVASDVWAVGEPEGSWLASAPGILAFLLLLVGIVTAFAVLQWLVTSDPRPERSVAEANLRTAEAEIATATQALAQKQAEIAQHQQMVSLGG
ncbi:MAG: hypothetical protein FJZ97_07205 [Chloroflexi bacterium]|nr:hypothetical protein [Chloroflexota bacterium]